MAKFGSKLEKQFAEILSKSGIKYITQFTIRKKRYDFYLPEFKILVEIDGNYIHTNTQAGFHIDKKFKRKIIRNDVLKNFLALYSGFKLVRIWESELSALNETNIRQKLLS